MIPLTIFYDNFCPNCTKFTKLVQKLDWLKLIQIKQLRNELHTNLIRDIDVELAKQQMASFDTKWHYGYNSLYYIFVRLPLFWLFVPFLYILKVTTLGQVMYSELALKRKIIPIHCDTKICDI
jgi:predicted DCC family thiol-disulfide oxidoreductase YuxK